MALSYVGTPSTGTLSGSAGPLTLTKPAGVAAGDLLIIFAVGSSLVSSPPSGFTNDATSTTTGSRFYHRIADGTEASSFSISYTGTQHVAAVCVALRGQAGTWQDPVTFPAVYDPVPSLTSCPVPAITLTGSSGWLLGFFCFGQLVAPGTFTLPGGMTQRVAEFKSGTGTADIGMIAGDVQSIGAGSTGTQTATTTGSANYTVGYILGVTPAAGIAGVATAAGAVTNATVSAPTAGTPHAGAAAAAGSGRPARTRDLVAGAGYDRLSGYFIGSGEEADLLTSATVANAYTAVTIQWYPVDSTPTLVAQIKARHPRTLVFAYQNFAGMLTSAVYSGARPSTLVTETEAAAHGDGADSWYLHRQSDATKITFSDFTWMYAANIGRASWRAAASQRFAAIKADGFDGVLLDDVNMHPGHGFDSANGTAASSEYAANNDYRDAVTAAMAVLKTAATAAGLLVVPNIGMDPWTAAHYTGYTAMLSAGSIDGVHREFWMCWASSAAVFTGGEWSTTLQIFTDAQAAGKFGILVSYPFTSRDDPLQISYGLASFYIGWGATDGSGFSVDYGRPVSTFGNYRVNLGTPTEAATAVGQGWRRKYTAGVAIINPAAAGNQAFTLGATYYDPSNVAQTSVTLGPGTGMVLISAPVSASAAAGVATGTGVASSPVFATAAASPATAAGIAPGTAFRYAPAGVAAGASGASAVPLANPPAGPAGGTGVAPAPAGVGFTTGQVPTPSATATGTAPRAGTAPTHAPAGVASGAGEASHGYAIAFGAPVSGADSLIIDGLIELLNGGVPSVHPVCPGARFVLVPGYSRGAPQPVTQVVASLLLDGERPTGRRTSNRTISLPVVIYGTSRANLNGARELLMQIVDQDTWQLQWTPDPQGGTALPLIFDCFRATSVEPEYDQDLEDELASRVTVTFPALPFGRSAGLTTLSFPSPSVSWASPPDPLKLDDYATVSSSTQAGWWSQSTQHLADSYSAHWDLSATDGDSPAWYTRTLAAPLDITSLTKLTFNFGLGVPDYRHWHRGNITFAVTLSDNTGHSLAFGGGAYCSASNDPEWPNWNKVTFAIPTSATFDYAHLNSYSVKAWRYVDCDGDYRLGGDAYLNGLTALAAAVPSYAAVRGTVYQVGAPGGTARTPMSAQFQATPKTALLTQTWSAAGDYTFLPPAGCYTLKVRAKGATGRGGDRSTSGAGGGAGGGAGVAHDTYPCTPGQPISLHVGAAGTSGGYPTLTASYYVEQDGANRTSLVTPSFTPIAGEILVVKALNGDTAQTFGTPTGGGLTWTSRVNIGTSQFNRSAIWTATAGASPMTVTVSCGGTSEPHAMIVERWGNAKLAGSPATMTSTGSGAPSGTLTTAANNSIVTWLNSDWNAVTGARTYRGTPTEQQYNVVSHYTGYWAYQQAASAGAQTVGLSAPGGQKWSMAGVEIQALNTGALIDGGPSTFDGTAFSAAGGSSVPVNTATGGLGGTTAASVVPAGGVKYRGGNGFTGTTTGGGAGSSAGDDAQGSDAASQTGATAPTGGINGGNGGAAGGNNAGVVPGGGAFSTGGSAAGAPGSDGKIQIWYTPPLTAFKTLIVHAPGFDAPPTLAPLIPAGAGLDPPDNREYTIASPVAGLNARYYGTYTIIAVLSTVDTPANARTLTCTFTQYDFPGGPSSTTAVARTLTPNTETPAISNGVIILGECTLPIRDIADDQTAAYFTVKVASTNAADRVLDILALDVRGQLTAVNVASGSGYVNYWLDEPDMNRDWGRVLASSYERSQAVSVLDSVLALTGGPLVIDPNGPGWMMAYSHDAGAPALTASFFSRWRDSRLA